MNIEKLVKEKIQLVTDNRKESVDDIENFMFLKRDLDMDDCEIGSLIIGLEEAVNINISEEDSKHIITVGDIITQVKRKSKKE